MAITILPPVVEDLGPHQSDSEDEMSINSDEDTEMGGVSLGRPTKRTRVEKKIGNAIVTPGEVVTDDPQWMR
jgi:exosome complex component RRP4